MVITLAIPLRKAFGLERLIRPVHFDAMSKLILMTSGVVTYAYITDPPEKIKLLFSEHRVQIPLVDEHGHLMAVATSVVGGRADPDTQSANGQTYFFLAPIFISLLVLAVPIVDVLFAIVRRTASGRSFAQADMGHLHHRLIQLGHGPRRAVVILWGWAALLSTVVLFSALYSTGSALVVLVIVGSALSVFTVLHPRIRRNDAQVHESDLVDNEPHA